MLIQDFGPAIINALLNKVSPNKLCSSIGLCSSAKSLKVGRLVCFKTITAARKVYR